MANALRISPSFHPLKWRKPSDFSSGFFRQCSHISISEIKTTYSVRNHLICLDRIRANITKTPDSSLDDDIDTPVSIELEPIVSEGQFDRIIAEAQQLEEAVIFVWMAGWCRKCIYLKPKLEKLAVDYYPRIRFYSIDVNRVPQRLVSRAGITELSCIDTWLCLFMYLNLEH
ncbi:thioredoxin-like 3-2, chloroplastic isoform X2 [Tasmannia lanceolata]|uniref:thioredoxin-like 3-2, chloroplastic isoform X2 n=1 Tax=Tasmannia lanceolata TaxID=3420 RepID=UPI004062C82F